jgi:leucyl/phenylalanyl-tRNA--protein transferase
MPVPVPPSRWNLTPPPLDYTDDLWAVGADLEPGTLLAAYAQGLFPMNVDGLGLGWFSPAERGVIPLAVRPPRTLRRAARGFEIRVDTAFAAVVAGCAGDARPHGWIDAAFTAAYTELHRLGWAHSVEAWKDEELAGGLYGVAIGGLFAAESMYRAEPGADKAALHGLVELLRSTPESADRLLDVQWLTPHLALLGAVSVTRQEYIGRLGQAAVIRDSPFTPSDDPPA